MTILFTILICAKESMVVLSLNVLGASFCMWLRAVAFIYVVTMTLLFEVRPHRTFIMNRPRNIFCSFGGSFQLRK